jgi:hypothetical protein
MKDREEKNYCKGGALTSVSLNITSDVSISRSDSSTNTSGATFSSSLRNSESGFVQLGAVIEFFQ